jgi:hypothetical protein
MDQGLRVILDFGFGIFQLIPINGMQEVFPGFIDSKMYVERNVIYL